MLVGVREGSGVVVRVKVLLEGSWVVLVLVVGLVAMRVRVVVVTLPARSLVMSDVSCDRL